jgi:4-hydroxybenzoate polyprenyltransferase
VPRSAPRPVIVSDDMPYRSERVRKDGRRASKWRAVAEDLTYRARLGVASRSPAAFAVRARDVQERERPRRVGTGRAGRSLQVPIRAGPAGPRKTRLRMNIQQLPDGQSDLNALALPLCVDLDGTLAHSDTLAEGVVTLGGDIRLVSALLAFAAGGRAALKRRVAELASVEAETLPYNEDLIAYLKEQKAAGRRLVLATAATKRTAEAVAAHLGLFDEIIASDEKRNLRGRAKAEALCARFGEGGFAYAGNDGTDLHVWRVAAAAVLVGASAQLSRRVASLVPIEAIMPSAPWAAATSLLRAMRPYQWVKNLLVFVPILTAHALTEGHSCVRAGIMFAALCSTASAIYLINDATDLTADRRHPRKRNRPFASGALPLSRGLIASALLFGCGLGLGAECGGLWVIVAYAALSLTYSLKLKEMPLADVFTLAALYTIRVFAGGVVTGHELSLWLLGFSGFLFLGLAILKRVAELEAQPKTVGLMSRRGYSRQDLQILLILGCAASFASTLVMALFVQREATAAQYASPILLWATVPIMLFWQCRLWLSTARGYMHDDPIVYSARDWVSWLSGGLVAALLVAAHSVKV